jgi:hypothetical protein
MGPADVERAEARSCGVTLRTEDVAGLDRICLAEELDED